MTTQLPKSTLSNKAIVQWQNRLLKNAPINPSPLTKTQLLYRKRINYKDTDSQRT